MKQFLVLLLLFSFVCTVTTACVSKKQKANMIQSKRRFAQYVDVQNGSRNSIDLSEGPRQSYDANLGPKSLNFDIKIVDPY